MYYLVYIHPNVNASLKLTNICIKISAKQCNCTFIFIRIMIESIYYKTTPVLVTPKWNLKVI